MAEVPMVIFNYPYTMFKSWKLPTKYLYWVKVVQAAEIPSDGLFQFYLVDKITFCMHCKPIHHLYQTVNENRNLTRYVSSYLTCSSSTKSAFIFSLSFVFQKHSRNNLDLPKILQFKKILLVFKKIVFLDTPILPPPNPGH